MTEAASNTQPTGVEGFQSALADVKEKLRRVAAIMRGLKDENVSLRNKTKELSEKVSVLESEVSKKEALLQEMKNQSLSRTSVEVGERLLYLSPDEREALERQIQDLLARIESHLS